MSFRFTSLTGLILAFYLIQGCTSPESKERLATAFCWLRPSCLPSQPSESKAPSTPAIKKRSSVTQKRSSTPPQPKQPQKVAAQIPPAINCVTSAETTMQASKPVRITYREPTTLANGDPLTDLEKTTIYIFLGRDVSISKDFPASGPQGGGKVTLEPKELEKILLPVTQGTTIPAKICVKATRKKNGLERDSK